VLVKPTSGPSVDAEIRFASSEDRAALTRRPVKKKQTRFVQLTQFRFWHVCDMPTAPRHAAADPVHFPILLLRKNLPSSASLDR
jgi:hypothetical protein